ncbi:MAG: hypothetical protein QXK94_08730 [Candidatus Jordarchaeales archaeon]
MPAQRFRLTPTGRGAVFRAKRWFYSVFSKNASEDIKARNVKAWTEMASKLVERMNAEGVSDKPTRLTIEYETGPHGEFNPVSATVEVYEMKPVKTFTVSFRETEKKPVEEKKVSIAEVQKVESELETVVKKLREAGLSPEELAKLITNLLSKTT